MTMDFKIPTINIRMQIRERRNLYLWQESRIGKIIIYKSSNCWLYRPLEDSPLRKYDSEMLYERDKENSPCLSNGIEPYSPPCFETKRQILTLKRSYERPAYDLTRSYERPARMMEPFISKRDNVQVQMELNPVEIPVSPWTEEHNENSPCCQDKSEEEVRSMCMFNNSVDLGSEKAESNRQNMKNSNEISIEEASIDRIGKVYFDNI